MGQPLCRFVAAAARPLSARIDACALDPLPYAVRARVGDSRRDAEPQRAGLSSVLHAASAIALEAAKTDPCGC